ncbi:MAG: hypothetical protein A3E78_10970 [Alphaproteobacteria bacterium RIFCSPHIGHO2_12_FULL_63_12]|nr:MAG: hypothetical protein A3E78_10970 [Alphaproteobacteria bacterium RIFCSPHIGHO2_12_FULL_63_12]
MTAPAIITRAQPGADETAGNVTSLGFRAIVSPMLRIVETSFDPAAAEGVHNLIFTSVNGVNAVRGAGLSPDLRAWCVGPSTADAARGAGFEHVMDGGGNANDLAGLILSSFPQGPLLHIANEDAAGTLVATLRAAGYDARFTAPYRTESEARLSREALSALGAPCLLLIHSAKGGAAVAASGADLSRSAVVAISAAALAPLKGRAGLGEWVAQIPNEAELMDALRLAGASLPG